MNRFSISLFIISAFCLIIFTNDIRADYVPGEIIVKFRGDTDPVIIQDISSHLGSVKKREFKKAGIQHLAVPEHVSVEDAVRYYTNDPNVEYAEPNYIVHIDETPNDSHFNLLWGLHTAGGINATGAWDITTGSSGVVIAVVDSGIAYTHPDMGANIWMNVGETSCLDGIDNDNNGYIDDCYGWDFLDNDNDPLDYHGHGTSVAGTIAAVGHNGLGITGVMWEAKIMVLRFLGVNGSGSTADAISAILYASANGAHIINNSWGGGGFSRALRDVIEASDAVVVCASGNNNANNDIIPHYPASYPSCNIISVASTNSQGNIAGDSNFGNTSVDLGAPGMSIYSTIPLLSYGAPVTLYSERFDDASLDLAHYGWSREPGSTWAVTDGTGTGGTNTLEDSPGGASYQNNRDVWAGYTATKTYQTPFSSVKNNRYTLSFTWRGRVDGATGDYLHISYSPDGGNWASVDKTNGNNTGFVTFSTHKITSAADLLNSFHIGFSVEAGDAGNYDGVYIDEVTLKRAPVSISGSSYASYDGTSMAAAYVSGVAGLIKARRPQLTSTEIKSAIFNSVDVLSSLSGEVLTSGRLNALQAVQEEDYTFDDGCFNSTPIIRSSSGGDGGGGCFIATAAYGSAMHPYVDKLRAFRDSHLLHNSPGRALVRLYYTYSPPVAEVIKEHEYLRYLARVMLVPVVFFVMFPYISSALFSLCIIVTAITIRRKKVRKRGSSEAMK